MKLQRKQVASRWWCNEEFLERRPDWATVQDIAKGCEVTVGTVYGWIKQGIVQTTTSDSFVRGNYLGNWHSVRGIFEQPPA